MAQKITSKNLSYDQSVPPFLRALRGQAASDANAPDPILASHRRPTKPRSGSADAEDAPLILDEDGNVVGDVEVGVDGGVRRKEGAKLEGEPRGEGGDEKAKEVEGKTAGIGAGKKRKAGKIVGSGADEEAGVEKEAKKVDGDKSAKGAAGAKDKKAKTKAKKVKLSFGDDEG